MVKFVHSADWQLGKQFANIAGDSGAFLRKQRIEAISKIGELASRHNADMVLVAGDVFDTNIPDARTIMQSTKEMAESFSGKWLLLPGNHDSAEPNGCWSRIKSNVVSETIVCLDEPRPYRLPQLATVVLPAPLKRRHEARDLTAWFDEYAGTPGDIRIGLAHGSLDCLAQYRGEAPNTIASSRIDSARLDYLALGDWHGTVRAGKRIAYSGTPEPDRFKQNDSGNVLLVTIEAPGQEPVIETIATRHFLWHEEDRQVFSAGDIDSIKQALVDLNHPLDRMLVRLNLSGTVSFEDRSLLEASLEKLSAQVLHMDSDLSRLLAQPTSDDLDEIEQSGFVRNAVNKLVATMNDKSNPQSEVARLALQILYVEHKKLEVPKC
jgi:DNA repair exonuclease SbcCD nuclease subunit